jgi:hypothetical protein
MNAKTMHLQIDVQFSYTDDAILPTYANAALTTLSPDGSFVIDFGFIDPLLVHLSQTQVLQELQANEQDNETNKTDKAILKVPAKTVSRIALSQELAKHLLMQIQTALDLMANVNKEKENATTN